MLGRLLHTAATSLNPTAYGRNLHTLESTTEEEHTRSLLFPDPTLLQHTSHAYPLQNGPPSPMAPTPGGYDDRGGLELDLNRDFRVIIAQEALGEQDEACVLLDTQMPPEMVANGIRNNSVSPVKPSPRHRRGGSTYNFQSPNTPTSPTLPKTPLGSPGGAFFKPRMRSATISLNEKESPGQDARDDTKSILDCMFGHNLLGQKGSRTKMHILSGDGTTTSATATKNGLVRDPDGTIKKEPRQRQSISRAHTYGAHSSIPLAPQGRGTPLADTSRSQNEAVLLTRVFNVNLPEPTTNGDETEAQLLDSDLEQGYPFPDMGNGIPEFARKLRKPKEKKTPAYAIAIVVRLPSVSKVAGSRPSSRRASQAAVSRSNGSLSSSLGSELPSSWTFLDAFPVPSARALAESIDARIDALVEHWDVVARTLSALQKDVSEVILRLLKEKDLALRAPAPKIPKEKAMQRTNQRIIQLMPYALFPIKELHEKSLHAASRLCFALRIPKVMTGQNRWSIWQDEARWIGRWAGGRDQNFFFFTLLTAFLGSQTEWLAELGPEWYRRRYNRQKKGRTQDELIPNRCVVVCADKMAARRLIFLLSSFLPSSVRREAAGSPLRPNTSSTHSPPGGHHSRQQSLRRTVNRRAIDRLAASSPDRRGLSTSVSSTEGDSFDIVDTDAENRSVFRNSSDNRSIRTTRLALPVNDLPTMKSSAATTATIIPNPATPIAHFTTASGAPDDYFSARARENSTSSAATTNLAENLKRHDTASASFDSDTASGSGRWGSLLSGIWSSKHDSSADTSTTLPSSLHGDPQKQSDSPVKRHRTPLEQMVEEASQTHSMSTPIDALRTVQRPVLASGEEGPDATGLSQSEAENLPIRLMVDESEGVVDVGIDVPGFYGTSVDSPLNSPPERSARRTPSIASMDGMASVHSHSSTVNMSASMTIESQSNVAGWLRNFHEDFVLQAVRPYAELESQIKTAMAYEPTPPIQQQEKIDGQGDEWVDVCSTLVADARNFTIKRYTLKRQLSNSAEKADGAATEISPSGTVEKNRPGEKIIIEPVMDLDSTLIDAVERVVARNPYPSQSASPVPGGSRHHSRAPSISTASGTTVSPVKDTIKDTLPQVFEVTRGECRKVITVALREIAQNVADEVNRKEGGRDIKGTNGNGNGVSSTVSDKARPKSSKGISEENTLREGIRKWLKAVEYADGY